LAINPVTPSTLYAGTEGGGVFESMDGGASWTDTGLPTSAAVTALEISPASPLTLYAGTLGGGVFSLTTTSTTTTLPCTTARCTLGAALTSPACAGQPIPASVTGKLNRAETLIDRAATSPDTKARKLRRRARHLLKEAGATATHAAKGKKAKLSTPCAADLKNAAGHVAAGL
jgi:hypothetical protein